MHAISSYRGNRPTNKQTHKQTGPITIHCAAKLSAQGNNKIQFGNLSREMSSFYVVDNASNPAVLQIFGVCHICVVLLLFEEEEEDFA